MCLFSLHWPHIFVLPSSIYFWAFKKHKSINVHKYNPIFYWLIFAWIEDFYGGLKFMVLYICGYLLNWISSQLVGQSLSKFCNSQSFGILKLQAKHVGWTLPSFCNTFSSSPINFYHCSVFNHTPPVISCVWQKISRLLYKSHYLSPLQHESKHLFANEI